MRKICLNNTKLEGLAHQDWDGVSHELMYTNESSTWTAKRGIGIAILHQTNTRNASKSGPTFCLRRAHLVFRWGRGNVHLGDRRQEMPFYYPILQRFNAVFNPISLNIASPQT